ncbi:hypothetical protein DFP91_5508 [Pseudorhodoplanes sinuspersici]|nr:hypothetical protein DFP91_5508 [Pseudorhodoplanes sinuspersici]
MPGTQRSDKPVPVGTTARRMADAVEFLTRVALEAGLCRVAGKLVNVRTNLMNIAAGKPEEDDAAEDTTMRNDQSERRRNDRH